MALALVRTGLDLNNVRLTVIVHLRASCLYLAVNEAHPESILPFHSKSAISQSGTWIDRSIIFRLMCVTLNAQKLVVDVPEAARGPSTIYLFLCLRAVQMCML